MDDSLSASLPPPPPPPKKSRTGLTIGILAGLLVLCLCCLALLAVGYFERDRIPGLSRLFASPTPEGLHYTYPAMGISLTYPYNWVYSQESDTTVTFANSQAAIDSTDLLAGSVGVVIVRDAGLLTGLPAGTDTSSPEAIVAAIFDPQQAFGEGSTTVLEPVRSFTLDGHPAASLAYSFQPTGSAADVFYLTLVLPEGTPVVAIAVCLESDWAQFRPVIDGLLASLSIQAAP
jgi:hypothetical protein